MVGRIARSRVTVGIVCTIFGATIVGGFAWAAIPGSGSGIITACYPTSGATKGQLRVIDYQSGARCTASERVLTWQSRGMRFMGAWSSTTSYGRDDVVTRKGTAYVATASNLGATPPGSSWATLAAQGPQGPAGPTGPAGPEGQQGPAGVTNIVPVYSKVASQTVDSGVMAAPAAYCDTGDRVVSGGFYTDGPRVGFDVVASYPQMPENAWQIFAVNLDSGSARTITATVECLDIAAPPHV